MKKTDVLDILKYTETLGYEQYERISQFIIGSSMSLEEAMVNCKKIDGFDFGSVSTELWYAMLNRAVDFRKFLSMETFIENILSYRQYGGSVANYFIVTEPYRSLFISFCADNEAEDLLSVMTGLKTVKEIADEKKLDPYKTRVWVIKKIDEYKNNLLAYCVENETLNAVSKYL